MEPLTWPCHICGRVRPDADISVRKTERTLGETNGIRVIENVRYCNDDPDCIERSKTFTFLPNADA